MLGTLDFDERTQAQALLVIDPDFVAKVRLWERRLGELHLMVEPVEPDGKIWERIKAKMPPPPPPPPPPTPEIKPAEPPVEPPISAETTPAPPTSTPPPTSELPAAEASGAEVMSAATPEPSPSFDPLTAQLPPAPSIPSPASLVPNLTPSVTPGVLPTSVSSPGSVLPSSMARPMPSSLADIPPVPGFLTSPPARVAGPASAAAAVLSPSLPVPLAEQLERADQAASVRKGGAVWRMLAMLMTLVVVALGGLIAAWRFAPDHVPPAMQPIELMRAVGINAGPPARKPAPRNPSSTNSLG